MPDQAFIIETDRERTAMLRALLQESGLDAVDFRDGNEAIHHIRESGAPRLAVVALSLAGASGFAVIREIRKIADRDHCAIVAISSFLELRSKAFALRDELAIDAVLAGDALAERIEKVIATALSRSIPSRPRPRVEGPPRLLALELEDDTELEAGLSHLARDVAAALRAPIGLISVQLGGRLQIEAHIENDDLDPRTHPEDWAFCRHPMDAGTPLIVNDARKHPVFRGEPLVQDGHVRAWIAAPLPGPSGRPFGALAVLDSEARAFAPDDVDQLVVLARRVAGDVLLRRRLADAEARVPVEPSLLEAAFDALADPVVVFDSDAKVCAANDPFRRLFAIPDNVVGLHQTELVSLQADRVVDFDTFAESLEVVDGPHVTSFLLETRVPHRMWRWSSRPFAVGKAHYQIVTCRDVTWQLQIARS